MRRQVERAPHGPISLIVDSSGVKVCGQGEWHAQKHGQKQQKRWKKLPIGVDAQGHIVASTVTESHAQDPSHVPELLSQVDRIIARFIGDGMYDKEPVYAAVKQHSPGARVIIPPRKDAVLSRMAATAPSQRDEDRNFKRYFATDPSAMHPLSCGGHQHPLNRSSGQPALLAAGPRRLAASDWGCCGWRLGLPTRAAGRIGLAGGDSNAMRAEQTDTKALATLEA
jgi:Transposase DDE domain